jgi:uncharacterized protein
MRLADAPSQRGQRENKPERGGKPEQRGGRKDDLSRPQQQKQQQKPDPNNAMAAAFARLKG